MTEIEWFDALIAPKYLEATNGNVRCWVGFNRSVSSTATVRVIGETIETEAASIVEALKDVKAQYEFLTSDITITG